MYVFPKFWKIAKFYSNLYYELYAIIPFSYLNLNHLNFVDYFNYYYYPHQIPIISILHYPKNNYCYYNYYVSCLDFINFIQNHYQFHYYFTIKILIALPIKRL